MYINLTCMIQFLSFQTFYKLKFKKHLLKLLIYDKFYYNFTMDQAQKCPWNFSTKSILCHKFKKTFLQNIALVQLFLFLHILTEQFQPSNQPALFMLENLIRYFQFVPILNKSSKSSEIKPTLQRCIHYTADNLMQTFYNIPGLQNTTKGYT